VTWVTGAEWVTRVTGEEWVTWVTGEEWVIWVTEEGAGMAETNLAVEGVKGAVAITGDILGLEAWTLLGIGASVTTGSMVIFSVDGFSVASSLSDASLASIISGSCSCAVLGCG